MLNDDIGTLGTEINPTRIDHLQKWLDKVLLSSMSNEEKDTAHTAALSPSAYFGVDRDNLHQLQVDRKSQDRIYRALFVYSSGIHQVIRENTLAEVKHVAVYKLWNVFLRVLENCDPVHTQLIVDAHETEQGRYFLDLINTQRIRLKKLDSDNEGYREQIGRLTSELETTTLNLQTIQSADVTKENTYKKSLQDISGAFSYERDGRRAAESTVAAQEQLIADLRHKNQVLTDRVSTLRDSLNISMSEAYQYQELAKQKEVELGALKAELCATNRQVSDLQNRLEAEIKIKLELTERVTQLNNALSLLRSEKDSLNGEFLSLSKTARATADCLGKCLTITPPIIKYIDTIEEWKNGIVAALDPAYEIDHMGPIQPRFSTVREMLSYYGVGSAYCNDKAKLVDISNNYSELISDIETLTGSMNAIINQTPPFADRIIDLIEKCSKVPSLQQELSSLRVQLAARECVSVAWREPCIAYQASSESYKDKYVSTESTLQRITHERQALENEVHLRQAVENSLRRDVKNLKQDIETLRIQTLAQDIQIQNQSMTCSEQEAKAVELESIIAVLNRDLNIVKDMVVRKEKVILELQEEVSDKADTIQSLGRTNTSVMSLFPILRAELDRVLQVMNKATQSCIRQGMHLPSSVVETTEAVHQKQLIQIQIDAVKQLNLIPSDLKSIVEVLESILLLTNTASMFNTIGEQAMTLSRTVHTLKVELEKNQRFMERERQRMADVMHYAADMETLSKGVGNNLTGGLDFIMNQNTQKDASQRAVIEAKEQLRLEHEARLKEREEATRIQTQQKADIRSLSEKCNALSKAMYGQKVNSYTQTNPFECLTCQENHSKVLHLQLELLQEKRRTCSDCAAKDDDCRALGQELIEEKSKTRRADEQIDRLRAQIKMLENECKENQEAISMMYERAMNATSSNSVGFDVNQSEALVGSDNKEVAISDAPMRPRSMGRILPEAENLRTADSSSPRNDSAGATSTPTETRRVSMYRRPESPPLQVADSNGNSRARKITSKVAPSSIELSHSNQSYVKANEVVLTQNNILERPATDFASSTTISPTHASLIDKMYGAGPSTTAPQLMAYSSTLVTDLVRPTGNTLQSTKWQMKREEFLRDRQSIPLKTEDHSDPTNVSASISFTPPIQPPSLISKSPLVKLKPGSHGNKFTPTKARDSIDPPIVAVKKPEIHLTYANKHQISSSPLKATRHLIAMSDM